MPDSNPATPPLNVPPESFQVRIVPDGWVFTTAPGYTVLQAGLAAGVELVSSCRNGTCRTCLCRLIKGEVAYLVDWPGVSTEEKAEGWFLPCVAQARSDLVVEQPMAWPTKTP